MRKTYNLKLVPMDKVGYKQGDILMTRQGEVTIAKGTSGKIGIKKPQRLVITSDEPIRSDEVQLNTKTNIISTFKVGGINPFKEYKRVIAAYPTIPDVPQIDISDIRRWIESGCPDSVDLEMDIVYGSYEDYEENETVHTTTAEPLLTNNTVKMVWGEQDKAQPIACVEDAAFYNKVYFLTLLAHRKDTAFDNPFHKYEYARMVQAIEAVKELMPPEYFAGHHPATDWENKAKDMKQTPLQTAIEQIRTQAEDYEKRGSVDNSFMLIYKSEALFDSINLLKSLLPYERECIERAVKDNIPSLNILTEQNLSDIAKDYFTSTYKQ